MPFTEHILPPDVCRNPEHDPPGMIVLPAGTHIYECPECGKTTRVFVPEVTL
jgi:hypothetical protein